MSALGAYPDLLDQTSLSPMFLRLFLTRDNFQDTVLAKDESTPRPDPVSPKPSFFISTMPIRNEHEEYALYLLEDLRVSHFLFLVFFLGLKPAQPRNRCAQCELADQECEIFTWGRACWTCERRLDHNCYLLRHKNWVSYYEQNKAQLQERSSNSLVIFLNLDANLFFLERHLIRSR